MNGDKVITENHGRKLGYNRKSRSTDKVKNIVLNILIPEPTAPSAVPGVYKPGARVTNSALAFTYIRILRCYIAQWHSGIKSRPIRNFLCHGRW